jgi:hypothetical protein
MRHSRTPPPKTQEAVAPDPGADAPSRERLRLGRPRVNSCGTAPRPCVRPRTLMLALLLAELLSACGGGGGGGQSGTATSVDSSMTPVPAAPT